jgi:reverse gyrase
MGTLFAKMEKFFNEGRYLFSVAEVPTGSGKSWMLQLLSEVVKKEFKLNILIAAPTHFLAKTAEERYGQLY